MNKIGRRKFLQSMGFGCTLLKMTTCISDQRHDTNDTRPNIVFLFSDDHLYTAMGIAGNVEIHTPHLDRLAERGVYFTHCYTAVPHCAPARTMVFTGQNPWTNGVYINGAPENASSPSMASQLKEAGYDTYFTGKWHSSKAPEQTGFAYGGDIFEGGMHILPDGHARPKVHRFGQKKKDSRSVDRFSSELFADNAIDFIRSRKNIEKPFALVVSFTAPHDPHMPPEPYRSMYQPQHLSIPDNFLPEPNIEMFIRHMRDEKLIPPPRTRVNIQNARSAYYGMISHLDTQIGRILRQIKDSGFASRTVIIYASDQGQCMGAHGVLGKLCLYEESIRTPLIVYHPKINRGSPKNSELTSLTDIFPTLCDVAGSKIPDSVEGKSLWELYQGYKGTFRQYGYSMWNNLFRSIHNNRYKLIYHLMARHHPEYPNIQEIELYDYRKDPLELNNLAGEKRLMTVQNELLSELNRWREKIDYLGELESGYTRPWSKK